MRTLLLLLTFQILTINCYIQNDSNLGIYCDGKIHDPNFYLPSYEVSSLCNIISYDNRYLIFIKSTLNSRIDAEYTKDTEMVFTSYCRDYYSFCANGFLISLYILDKKIRIHAGSAVRTQISVSDREYIIEMMKPYLQRKQYRFALEKAVEEIRKSVKYIALPNQPVPVNSNKNTSSSSGIGTFFLILLISCPICICIGCIIAVMKTAEKKNHNVYEHSNLLMNLLNEVRASYTRTKIIDFCLICTKCFPTFNPDFPNNNPLYSQDNIVRFQCGHLYHNSCLMNHGINQCLMCDNHPSAFQRVPNFAEYRQEINEIHLINFMQKMNRIYSKQELEEYYESYPDHRCQVESSFGITMVACFGITALATGALLASSMDTHHYHNDNYYYHNDNTAYQNNQVNNYNQGSANNDIGDTAGGSWD